MYIKFILLPPPPSWIHIFAPNEVYYNEGLCEKCSAFFCAILYIFSQLGKKYTYFFPIGEKICIFPPFFYPLSIIFSPQPVIWPYFWGVKQKNIHPWGKNIHFKSNILYIPLQSMSNGFKFHGILLLYTLELRWSK